MATNWDIPFDPADINKVGMFVKCPTYELAQEFLGTYFPASLHKLSEWYRHEDETVYTTPGYYEEVMYGATDSYDDFYISKGYVPRVYLGMSHQLVEVGDLL